MIASARSSSPDLPYIDVHTHHMYARTDVISIKNIVITQEDIPTVYCSVGIHPWYIDDDVEQYTLLEKSVHHGHVLAIGECGLDKVISVPLDEQTKAFIKQAELAELVRKPLIIHCVRAYQETLEILDRVSVPVVFHGFNKKIELARQIIEKRYHISLGTAILRGHMDELICRLPMESIFLETDDKPIGIMDVYAYFCSVRKIPLQELKQQMVHNFERVFKQRIV